MTFLPLASIGWKVLDRFRFGSDLALSPHGLGIAIGFLAGSYVFLFEARKRGYSEEDCNSLIFWALVGTIIGSRLGYVFTHLSEFHNAGDVLAIYRGGLSQLGGVGGAVLVCYFAIRKRGLSFLAGLDSAAIPIPLGVVIGRVGDLIIGDHLGKPTSWVLAFTYHGGSLSGYDCSSLLNTCATALSGGQIQTINSREAVLTKAGTVLGRGVGVHQTALYDFFMTMALVLVLILLNRHSRRAGVLFFAYMLWYGSGRILTDFLRVENRFFGLTGSQWTSSAAVAFATLALIWFALRPSDTTAGIELDPGGPK